MCRPSALGDAPPIFFVCDKENGPCTVQKKTFFSAKTAPRAPFCFQTRVVAVGAVQTCRLVPSALWSRGTENCFPAFVGIGAAFGVDIVWSRRLFPLPLARGAGTARSEAERAGPERQTFRRPPRKQVGTLRMRRQAIPVPPVYGAPGRILPAYAGTGHDNFRVCGQLDTFVSS